MEFEVKRKELLEKYNALLKSIKELEMEKDIIEKNLKEYRDFSKAIKEIFRIKDMFPGLIDVVTNIIEVDFESALAIGVLLGGNAQNIVVKDVETAKEIINYLKKNEIGRVTILPLDLIESRELSINGVENHPGFVGYASKMVKVPPGFEKLPGYLFGSDIIVKTLDDAIDIKTKYNVRSRIISLDGQMVHGRGAISGGSTKAEEIRTPFKGKIKLEEIKKKLSAFLEDLSKTEKDLAFLDKEIETLTKQEKIIERELSDLSLKVINVKRTKEDLARSIERMEEEIEELEKLKKEYHMKLEGMMARREKALKDMENIYKTRKQLESKMKEFSEILSKEKKVLDELSEKILDLRLEVGNLREKSKRYEEELENINERKNRIDEEKDNLSKESESLEKEIDRLKKMIRENQRELETLRKETEELFENLRYRKTGKEEKLKEMENLENRMGELKEEAEKLREYLHHLDLSIQESEMKFSNILRELGQQEPEDVEEIDQITLENIEKEIRDLENRIKYLGPVDLEAIDEYKKIEEEYENLLKQKEDLEEAKRKLLEIIEKT
ncbi:MAG TPA: chromosome segregation protein SMC, partial [Thermotoga sp.]|nr:chromosome segregation protein SMC [Thermotoga sp.]